MFPKTPSKTSSIPSKGFEGTFKGFGGSFPTASFLFSHSLCKSLSAIDLTIAGDDVSQPSDLQHRCGETCSTALRKRPQGTGKPFENRRLFWFKPQTGGWRRQIPTLLSSSPVWLGVCTSGNVSFTLRKFPPPRCSCGQSCQRRKHNAQGLRSSSIHPKSRCVWLRLKVGIRFRLLASPVPAAMLHANAAPRPGKSGTLHCSCCNIHRQK